MRQMKPGGSETEFTMEQKIDHSSPACDGGKKRKQTTQSMDESAKKPLLTVEPQNHSQISHILKVFQSRSKAIQQSSATLCSILERKNAEGVVLLRALESLVFDMSTIDIQSASYVIQKSIQSSMRPLASLRPSDKLTINNDNSFFKNESVSIIEVSKCRQILLIGLLARVVQCSSSSPNCFALALTALIQNTEIADISGIYLTVCTPQGSNSKCILQSRSAKVLSLGPNRKVFLSALITIPLESFLEVNRKEKSNNLSCERILDINIGLGWMNSKTTPKINVGYQIATCSVRESDLYPIASSHSVSYKFPLDEVLLKINSTEENPFVGCVSYPLVVPMSRETVRRKFSSMVSVLEDEDLLFYSYLCIDPVCFQNSQTLATDKSKFIFSVSSAISLLKRESALSGLRFHSSDRGTKLGMDESMRSLFIRSFEDIELGFCGQPFVLLMSETEPACTSAVRAFIVSESEGAKSKVLATIKAKLVSEVCLCRGPLDWSPHLLPGFFSSSSHDAKQNQIHVLQCIVQEMRQVAVAFREMARRIRDRMLRSDRGVASIGLFKDRKAKPVVSLSNIPDYVLGPRLVCTDSLLVSRILEAREETDLAILDLLTKESVS